VLRFSRFAWIFMALALAVISAPAAVDAEEKPLKIVTTIFPEYDWVMNVLGERAGDAEVTWLMQSGVDLHSFNPSVEDIVTITDCDLFLYVGGESDFWVEDVLSQAPNGNLRAVSLLDILADQVREEETVEGMQDAGEDAPGEEPEIDEHVWMSLENAGIICRSIADVLGEMDEEHAEEYSSSAEEYIAKLDGLDDQYHEALNDAPNRTLVFGDRFPFRYLFDDYGLSYYAAFSGCSAESEASFETIIFLAEKVDELGLDNILKMEGDNKKICETVIECTETKDQEILTLDSMQSVKREDYENGITYTSIMEENLEVLKRAAGVSG